MKISHGGLGASIVSRRFSVPTACKCKKFKQIQLRQVGFWVSLLLLSVPTAEPLECLYHLPKFWAEKLKGTTKTTFWAANKFK